MYRGRLGVLSPVVSAVSPLRFHPSRVACCICTRCCTLNPQALSNSRNAAQLARDAVDNLQQLGPTFVKLGQIMSIRCVPPLLPTPPSPARGEPLVYDAAQYLCACGTRYSQHNVHLEAKQLPSRVAQEFGMMNSSVRAHTRGRYPRWRWVLAGRAAAGADGGAEYLSLI